MKKTSEKNRVEKYSTFYHLAIIGTQMKVITDFFSGNSWSKWQPVNKETSNDFVIELVTLRTYSFVEELKKRCNEGNFPIKEFPIIRIKQFCKAIRPLTKNLPSLQEIEPFRSQLFGHPLRDKQHRSIFLKDNPLGYDYSIDSVKAFELAKLIWALGLIFQKVYYHEILQFMRLCPELSAKRVDEISLANIQLEFFAQDFNETISNLKRDNFIK